MGTVGLYSIKKWGQVQFPTEKPFPDRKVFFMPDKMDLTLFKNNKMDLTLFKNKEEP